MQVVLIICLISSFDENIKRYSTRYRKAANLPVRIKNNAEGVESTALPNKGAGDTINVLSNAYINNDGYLVLQKQSVTIPSAVAGGGGTATDALTLNKAESRRQTSLSTLMVLVLRTTLLSR